jgi:fatty-acyl-CoA synthase
MAPGVAGNNPARTLYSLAIRRHPLPAGITTTPEGLPMPVKINTRTASAYAYPLLIKHLLHTPLACSPDQEIVYRDRLRYTYRDFRGRIARLANALTKLGIRAGDTVAMMDWDSHRYLETYFAVPMMGAILQSVNARLSPDQILYTLNHAEAKILIVNRDFLPLIEASRDHLQHTRIFVLIDETDAPMHMPQGFAGEYEKLVSAASAEHDFPDFDENAVATTFYTSGTTGLPKGVCFTHRQLVLHTLAAMGALSSTSGGQCFRHGDVYMPITPMFHVHAWGVPYMATVMGAKQVYPGRYEPEMLLRLKQKEGVTYSHCVPTILHMLLTCPYAAHVDFSGWKMTIGGSALPMGLAKAAVERGIDVFAGYGMSETCPLLTMTRLRPEAMHGDPDADMRLRCKAGLPVPLVDLRIVDPDMNDVPHDGKASGEVVVRAPWLAQHYVGNEAASEELWRGGYLHTQDVAQIDAFGYVQITDRIKDVIKTGGEWVSSLLVEDLISRYPAVSEVAVFGVKDERWGERPVALVVAKPGQATEITAQTIKAHLMSFVDEGLISKYAIPERVQVVQALEKTSVGKLNKKLMREQYAKDSPTS